MENRLLVALEKSLPTGTLMTNKQKEDVIRLQKENQKINLKLVVKQIEYGLENIYDRFFEIKKRLKPRDSSSLLSFTLKYGEYWGKIFFEEKRKKTVHTLEMYIKRYGEKEGEKKYKELCSSKSHSLEAYIKRHGEKEGKIKHEEYWKNTNFSTSKEAFVRRHGKQKGEDLYGKFRKKIGHANTLQGNIERYGEKKGKEKYIDQNNRKRKSQSKSVMVERMLEEGYSFDEILYEIEKRWSRSLKTYQEKHGKEEGKRRYKEWVDSINKGNPLSIEYYRHRNISDDLAFEMISDIQHKRQSKVNTCSKESLMTILPIMTTIYDNHGYKCVYGENEFSIRLSKKEHKVSKQRHFFYDFFVPDLNIIIEYHGELYHENIDYNQTKNMIIEDFVESYSKDLFKKWIAEQKGYEVFVVRSWEKQEDLLSLYHSLHQKGVKYV